MKIKDEIKKLAQETGLSETEAEAILKALDGNEKFAKALDGGYLRQSDYSRSMDQLRKEKQEQEAKQQEWLDWYGKAEMQVKSYEQRIAELEAAKSELGEFEQKGGRMINPETGETMTVEAFNKQLRELQQHMAEGNVRITKGLTKVAIRHLKDFDEELDPDELDKHMAERGISDIEEGWRSLTAPKREEKTKKEFEERIKKEREEAVAAWAAKNHLPVDPRPKSDFVPLSERIRATQEPVKPVVGQPSRAELFDTFAEGLNSK